MTDPKDAERLAQIRHREYQFRTKFDNPNYDPMPEQDGEFLIRLLDTAEKQAIRLTQERDAVMESLLSSMRHNSIATGHGDTIPDLIGEINAWIVETRVLLLRTLAERDEARRSAEWLRRIVQWCSKRLRHQSYADTLAAKLAAGATDVPDDEPAIVQSDATQPTTDDVERKPPFVSGAQSEAETGAPTKRCADTTAGGSRSTSNVDDVERAREPENLAQQLIDGANREGVDTYTKTLLWHATSLIDRLTQERDTLIEGIPAVAEAAGREARELRALDETVIRKHALLDAFQETMPRENEAWSRGWHDAANLIRARISALAARDAAVKP